MKYTKIWLISVIALAALFLVGCTESTPQVSDIGSQPEAAVQAALTAEEVLPPVEKNIFLNGQQDVYHQSISAGIDGCAVIFEDGSLVSWGEPVAVGGMVQDAEGYFYSSIYNNLTYISCAQFDTFAIDEDGCLWGWGMVRWQGNILGDTTSDEPLRLMTDVQMASCGAQSYLALRKDGTVWMWGSGEYGTFGMGPEYTKYTTDEPLLEPIKVLEDVIYANMDGLRGYAIKTDNSLWTWGYMGADSETGKTVSYDRPVCIMEDVKYASGNFAVKTDGTLWIFDSNSYNKQSAGGEILFYGFEPVQIMEDVRLAKGWNRVMVIKNDGSLWVWGDNSKGALGNGTDDYVAEPMQILDDVVNVASSESNIYALKSNGELWEMGVPYGKFSEYTPTEEELFQSRLPHKVLESVLIG